MHPKQLGYAMSTIWISLVMHEISETIAAAGYKTGGRVGYRFGGIDAALDKVEDEEHKRIY